MVDRNSGHFGVNRWFSYLGFAKFSDQATAHTDRRRIFAAALLRTHLPDCPVQYLFAIAAGESQLDAESSDQRIGIE